MRTLTLTGWVVSSRMRQLQVQEAQRPGRQRWRCQQLPRLRVLVLHRVLQQDTHQRPRPEEHQPEKGTHDFKNREAVEHLTTSDPHAGIVPLQQGLDRWERVLRLHRSIDPHQSPHCVRILEEKKYQSKPKDEKSSCDTTIIEDYTHLSWAIVKSWKECSKKGDSLGLVLGSPFAPGSLVGVTQRSLINIFSPPIFRIYIFTWISGTVIRLTILLIIGRTSPHLTIKFVILNW